ncbi:MAG TPA: AarF/UbiB family protein [Amnibacterium sp.]|jgi:predicted unusual protein kinase regulating ubiquinone biosynthesis (AarF/ABC1/UbiB family)|nr:AarF/UbiB family protein [Amnibacterium sp.]
MPYDRRGRARYRRILRFAMRYLAQNWWFELALPRVGLAALAARGRTRRWRRMAREFYGLATELGGLMIKVGQFLSTRLDVLPPEVTHELQGLQDEVQAEDFAAIRVLAESELGATLESAYASFDPVPMAAASLGQAHRARLTPDAAADTGFADVVVKIQRPGIETIVDVDLAALRRVAGWLNRVRLVARRVNVPALAEEFATTSLEEIDYLHEAQNAERFAQQFEGNPGVRVPTVAWDHTTRRVLTLQDVGAIKINDLVALRAAGIDPSAVAARFVTVMFDQLFFHGFFHGDAHPGNLFVTPLRGDAPSGEDGTASGGAWALTFVDFGMMGEVPDGLRARLRQFLIAVAARDGRRLVASMRDLGVLLPTADARALERTMSAIFDRFGGLAITSLQNLDPSELRRFADEFGEAIRVLPFQLPEHFLLIIRAVSLTSGLSSTLDPDFNIWNAVEPYADQLLRDEQGGLIGSVAREAASVAGIAVRLPRRLDELASRLEAGEMEVATPGLERRLARLERTARRVVSAFLFMGLLIGGVLARPTDVVLGTVLMGVSALFLLHAVLAGVVGGRARR